MAQKEPKELNTDLEEGTEDTLVQPSTDATSGTSAEPMRLAMRVSADANLQDDPPEPIRG